MIPQNASNVQLAQLQLTTTGFETLLSGNGFNAPQLEITRLFVTNTTGSPVSVTIAHDYRANGSPSYSAANAIVFSKSVPANDFLLIASEHPGGGIPVGPFGSIGVQASVANAVTVTAYGVAAVVQESEQGFDNG